MGNIQSEVFPINFISRRRKELHAVNRISMHHPARPQMKKFFLIVVIVFMEVVCAEIVLLFTATDKSAIRIAELARKRLIGDLAVNSNVIAKLCREKTHARLDKSHTFAYNVDDKAV